MNKEYIVTIANNGKYLSSIYQKCVCAESVTKSRAIKNAVDHNVKLMHEEGQKDDPDWSYWKFLEQCNRNLMNDWRIERANNRGTTV